jgi:hypothetical protein
MKGGFIGFIRFIGIKKAISGRKRLHPEIAEELLRPVARVQAISFHAETN